MFKFHKQLPAYKTEHTFSHLLFWIIGLKDAGVFLFFFQSLSIYTIVITIKCSSGHVYTQKVTVTSVLYHLTKKVVLIFIYTLKIYYKISFVGRILFQIKKLFTEVKRLRQSLIQMFLSVDGINFCKKRTHSQQSLSNFPKS